MYAVYEIADDAHSLLVTDDKLITKRNGVSILA